MIGPTEIPLAAVCSECAKALSAVRELLAFATADTALAHQNVSRPASLTEAGVSLPAWDELSRILTFRGGMNTSTVIAGTSLLGLAAGVIGVFALLRKRSLVADALSHATLPGIVLAFLAAAALGFDGRSLPLLMSGAVVTGVLGVLCIQMLVRHTRLHEDAAIGIVLSVFFGAGVVLLSVVQTGTHGNAAGLNHFIYGQTAAMSRSDAVVMGGIGIAAIVTAFVMLKEITLVCFNDDFARVAGWPVTAIDLVIMALVVLVTASGLQAVGLLLVVAMLIIPPVSARFWTDRVRLLVVLSGVFGALGGYLGSVVSASLPRQPAGAVIVLTSGVLFVLSMAFAPKRGVLATGLKRFRLRVRIAGDHLLETAFEHARDHGDTVAVPADVLRRLARRRGWPRYVLPMLVSLLRRRGLIARRGPTGFLLSPEGKAAGARVSRNHLLWAQYLVSHADIAPSHVDWSVDQVEHVLTPGLVEGLERSLRDRGVAVPPRTEGAG